MNSYWQLDMTPVESPPEELAERLIAALRTAVRRRLAADVEIGAFLSGGVDSSLVVALLSEVTDRPVRTFSIGFGDRNYDERPFARQVAARYGTNHEELTVEADAWRLLPSLGWHFGEPFGDSSAIPTACVAQLTADRVKVGLSGDGGDETFAGYGSYPAVHRVERWWFLPDWVRRSVLWPVSAALHSYVPASPWAIRLRSHAQHLSGDLQVLLRRDVGWIEPYRARLYTAEFRSKLSLWHPADAFGESVRQTKDLPYEVACRLIVFKEILPADYLTKIDVASMMYSLELRCPFLDRDLVDLTAHIPLGTLLGPRNEAKWLLKRLALEYLPKEEVLREKRGFEIPIGE